MTKEKAIEYLTRVIVSPTPNTDTAIRMAIDALKRAGRDKSQDSLDDTEIIRFDGITVSAVYIGFLEDMKCITKELPWRKDGEPMEYGQSVEWMTLKDISDYANRKYPNAIVTVFSSSPLHGEIYQYGNYRDVGWVGYGRTMGYA